VLPELRRRRKRNAGGRRRRLASRGTIGSRCSKPTRTSTGTWEGFWFWILDRRNFVLSFLSASFACVAARGPESSRVLRLVTGVVRNVYSTGSVRRSTVVSPKTSFLLDSSIITVPKQQRPAHPDQVQAKSQPGQVRTQHEGAVQAVPQEGPGGVQEEVLAHRGADRPARRPGLRLVDAAHQAPERRLGVAARTAQGVQGQARRLPRRKFRRRRRRILLYGSHLLFDKLVLIFSNILCSRSFLFFFDAVSLTGTSPIRASRSGSTDSVRRTRRTTA